jgi:hypothetical protein
MAPILVAAPAAGLVGISAHAGPVSFMGPKSSGESAARPADSRDVNATNDTQSTIQGGTVPPGATTEAPGMWNPEALTGSNMLAGMLMAGGVLIIVFILMKNLRRNQRATAADTMTTAERVAAIRARAGEKNNIDAFKADVHDFTRRMAALLDNKAERLEQLIADADERLDRLERAEARGGARPAHHDEPAPAPHHEPTAPPPPARARRSPPDLDRPVSVDPLHDRVYRLADSGLDPIAIARETGQPTGQIELILALRS